MDGIIGEIRLFAGNFNPRGWALCQGQLIAIAQNSALFSILGTTYGGNGTSTFALPDLRGRVPVQQGTGPGLSNRDLGQVGGEETVTLTINQTPSHSHVITGTVNPKCNNATLGEENTPSGNFPAKSGAANIYVDSSDATMGASTITATAANTGGNQPHDNMQPFLALNYIICLEGVYPSRD